MDKDQVSDENKFDSSFLTENDYFIGKLEGSDNIITGKTNETENTDNLDFILCQDQLKINQEQVSQVNNVNKIIIEELMIDEDIKEESGRLYEIIYSQVSSDEANEGIKQEIEESESLIEVNNINKIILEEELIIDEDIKEESGHLYEIINSQVHGDEAIEDIKQEIEESESLIEVNNVNKIIIEEELMIDEDIKGESERLYEIINSQVSSDEANEDIKQEIEESESLIEVNNVNKIIIEEELMIDEDIKGESERLYEIIHSQVRGNEAIEDIKQEIEESECLLSEVTNVNKIIIEEELMINEDIKGDSERLYKIINSQVRGDEAIEDIKEEGEHLHSDAMLIQCKLCEYRTNHISNLRHHLNRKHVTSVMYKCASCDFETDFRRYLERHVKHKHTDRPKYKCLNCNYETTCKDYLVQHIKRIHNSEIFECNFCKYKTTCREYLSNHFKKMHAKFVPRLSSGVKWYKCDECNCESNLAYSLRRHQDVIHTTSILIECKICDYRTNHVSNLQQHVKKKHIDSEVYKCNSCDYVSHYKQNVEKHKLIKHTDRGAVYKCERCEYETTYEPYLERHMKVNHLDAKEYKCEYCAYETSHKPYLNRHMKNKHVKPEIVVGLKGISQNKFLFSMK